MHITPSEEEIQLDGRSGFRPRDDVRDLLIAEAEAETSRLESFMPKTISQVEKALAVADEAQRRAAGMVQSRKELLAEIESAVNSIAGLRLDIRLVKTLQPDAASVKALAERALDLFLVNQGPHGRRETESLYASHIEVLSCAQALAPFVGSYLANLESQLETKIAAVRAKAVEAKFCLRNAITLFLAEKQQRHEAVDPSLFEGIAA